MSELKSGAIVKFAPLSQTLPTCTPPTFVIQSHSASPTSNTHNVAVCLPFQHLNIAHVASFIIPHRTSHPAAMPASPDPFDDILNLEERFYQDGYDQGVADGAQAGRIEGRSFGMQKGFEKFLESGRLASRAVVWANRVPSATGVNRDQKADDVTAAAVSSDPAATSSATGDAGAEKSCTLPSLPGNARLDKNVKMLYALVEPDTLSTQNADEAVQDFDDRLKRAQGKAKVVERMTS